MLVRDVMDWIENQQLLEAAAHPIGLLAGAESVLR
jgi:hypothetical protein